MTNPSHIVPVIDMKRIKARRDHVAGFSNCGVKRSALPDAGVGLAEAKVYLGRGFGQESFCGDGRQGELKDGALR
jgi:hypothetical protein